MNNPGFFYLYNNVACSAENHQYFYLYQARIIPGHFVASKKLNTYFSHPNPKNSWRWCPTADCAIFITW
jgi:hypothetical protein